MQTLPRFNIEKENLLGETLTKEKMIQHNKSSKYTFDDGAPLNEYFNQILAYKSFELRLSNFDKQIS